MSKYLRKFETEAAYSAATIYTPSVSLIASNMSVKFDPYIPPAPTFSGLTVYYNISDISQPTDLFYAAGGSGSGSGSGGVLPSAMIIDGTEVDVTSGYAFDTVGEHIVNYSFADNQIPNEFLNAANTQQLMETVRKVEIDDSITSIGNYAFDYCSGLTSVTLGNGVTSIGEAAFYDCTSLTSITIPDSVTSIGSEAFSMCGGLTSVTLGNGVTSIGEAAFYDCTSLTEITIPSGVTSINSRVFYGCTGLTSVTLGNNVTSIGQNAFNRCTSLASIDIPSGVTYIGQDAFNGCESLTGVTIPNSVTSIADGTFRDCIKLSSCTIGSGVTSIGNDAFSSCGRLSSITSNAMTAPTIANSTFGGIDYRGTLTVPSGSQNYCDWIYGGYLSDEWTIKGVTCE